MKYLLILAGLLMSSFSAAIAADAPAPAAAPAPTAAAPATQPSYPADMDTVGKRVSYGIGIQFGANLKNAPFAVDTDLLIQGIRDSAAGKAPRLTADQIRDSMKAMQEVVQTQQAAQNKVVSMQNQKEGDEFLAKNKTAEGVKTTATGLQYQIIKEGTGKTPTKDDTVTVNYTGRLINGKVFDTSEGREPFTTPVSRVITGWTEGLQLMKVGGKAKFYIPANLAYGENVPPGGPIPPNAVLIFDVELVSVK